MPGNALVSLIMKRELNFEPCVVCVMHGETVFSSLWTRCKKCDVHMTALMSLNQGSQWSHRTRKQRDSSYKISNETVVEIEISFQEKGSKYLEFLFFILYR